MHSKQIIVSDLRYSIQSFIRAPGLSFALLITIALGVGSNVSIHGFFRGLTESGAPPPPERIVSIFERIAHQEAGPLSLQDYFALRGHPETFEWIGAARITLADVALPGQTSVLSVASLSPEVAAMLHLPLDKGIVISQRIWRNQFRAGDNIAGEQILLDGVAFQIEGVAPAWLEGIYRDRPIDVWIPRQESELQRNDGGARTYWVLGRLRAGVPIEQARTIAQGINSGASGIAVLPYRGVTPEAAEDIARIGTPLNLGAGLLLFIACANVASFLVGRASVRSHETSLRVALGARRSQLVRGLLCDSVVITFCGGALGLLLAVWTSRILPALLFENDAQQLNHPPDIPGLLEASLFCAAITVLCGLLPVFLTSQNHPAAVLRREGAGASKAIQRLRASLMIAQMTCCSLLVISTAFLLDGFQAALQTSVSRRLGQPILASARASSLAGAKYFERFQIATQAVRGVSPVAWMGRMPGSLPSWRSFHVDLPKPDAREVTMDVARFTDDSPALFSLPPIAGRLFGIADQTCRAAVVNEEAANALFGADTVGRSIRDAEGLPVEIVGVLKRKKAQGIGRPAIYFYNAGGTVNAPAHFHAAARSKLELIQLDVDVVSRGYFEEMGLSLVAGRAFPKDSTQRGCRIAVINQQAADLYFGGKAVGAAVIDGKGVRTQIIGVVHSAPLGAFQARVEPAIYFPMAQDCMPRMTLILSAREANGPILAALRTAIEGVPGRAEGLNPIIIRTLETQLGLTALAPLRIAAMILSVSTAMALFLSVMGLFATLNDTARQRRREFAIRIALGARRRHIVFQLLWDGGRLACAGAAAGTLGALLLAKLLTRITPGDRSPALWVWFAAPVALTAAVMIASTLPARSALIANPLIITRDDN